MKKQKLYYGLHFKKNSNIEDSALKELAFLLLLSPSTDISEVKAVINDISAIRIDPYTNMIKQEVQDFKESISSGNSEEYKMFPDHNPINKIIKKLESWVDEFSDIQIHEIELAADFYKVDRELLKGIIGRKNMEYPEDVFRYLSKTIIGQDDALKKMSVITASYKRSKNHDMQKQVPLLVGNTGTGKTLIGSNVGKLLSPNYMRLSCGQLVPEGIKGETISDSLTNLWITKGKFNNCVLHFDEIDKLTGNFSGDLEYGRKLQFELLNILENDSIIRFPESFERNAKYVEINSKNIFIILSGAFSDIENIISKRLKNEKNVLTEVDNLKKQVISDDIQRYGIIPELAGRISSVIALDTLRSSDIKKIIRSSIASALSKHTQNLSLYDIKLTLTDSAVDYISNVVYNQKLGARYTENILNELTNDIYFHAKDFKGQTISINDSYIEAFQFTNKYGKLIKEFNNKPVLCTLTDRFSTSIDTVLDIYNKWNKIKKGGNYVFI